MSRLTAGLVIAMMIAFVASANAAISTTANANGTVTIAVTTTIPSHAVLQSATINQAGRVFTIEQNIAVACQLPSVAEIPSVFTVGPLDPGTYTVRVNVRREGAPQPPCGNGVQTEEALFRIANDIPLLDGPGLGALVVMLTLVAAALVRR